MVETGPLPLSILDSKIIPEALPSKFAFNSSSHATDIGNLVGGVSGWGAGTSSTTYGYIHGGSPSYRNVIEKFSFSTDGNSTDVGDLVTGVQSSSGAQH